MKTITVQLAPDSPITEMDERELAVRIGGHDNDNETVTWVEYRLLSDPDGRVVHRSVDMKLKVWPKAVATAGEIPH